MLFRESESEKSWLLQRVGMVRREFEKEFLEKLLGNEMVFMRRTTRKRTP